MIQKIKNVLKKRKAKLFFVFLVLSGLAWFISNLSNRYQGGTTFKLEFINPPDSMMLVSASNNTMNVRLDAVGFQFLMFNLGKREVEINLSDARKKGKRYFLPPESGRDQIEKQLTNGIKLLGITVDTLFFEFYDVIDKKVPVKAKVNIGFSQNYFLDGKIEIDSDSVVVKGPINEVDTIQFIETATNTFSELKDDFSFSVKLMKSPALVKTIFSHEEVRIGGSVSRFSEKIISVPVKITNLPENIKAQTFPEEVDVLIKASVSDLKKIKSSDIKVVGDYATVRENGQKSIRLSIVGKPNSVHSTELSTRRVDFILKRE